MICLSEYMFISLKITFTGQHLQGLTIAAAKILCNITKKKVNLIKYTAVMQK